MKRSVFSSIAVLLAGLFMLGSFGICFAADKPLVIKANIPTTADAPYGMGIKKFVEAANAKTKSVKFELQLFPSSQLGGTRETVEKIQMGSITMTACSSGFLSGFAPSIAVFDLPYLFRDSQHAYKVMDGPVGDTVKQELLSKDIRLLGFFENGWRHLTNNSRPIKCPEDLKGLKIRVMESPLMVSTLNSMGAIATAMDWSEVITSLKTGVIDGQENVPMNIWNDKTYEVQKHISLTYHFYNPGVLLISESFFKKLPKDVQDALIKAGNEATVYERGLAASESEKSLERVVKAGMVLERNPDIEAFRKSVEPVYAKFGEKYAKLIKIVRETK
jgi:tripartite ATP-independent transporter DctP family solute receptor